MYPERVFDPAPMDELIKNAWEVRLGFATLIGALLAFGFGLYQWHKGLVWQRASKGRELVDDLLKSNDSDHEYYAWDAMQMLDAQEPGEVFRTKKFFGKAHDVTRVDIHAALGPTADASDNSHRYVRECFDELYFKMGQLQDAIDNSLVELRHVSSPVDYYVELMAKHAPVHYSYMLKNRYDRALRFLDNFPSWREARPATPESGAVKK